MNEYTHCVTKCPISMRTTSILITLLVQLSVLSVLSTGISHGSTNNIHLRSTEDPSATVSAAKTDLTDTSAHGTRRIYLLDYSFRSDLFTDEKGGGRGGALVSWKTKYANAYSPKTAETIDNHTLIIAVHG